MVQHQEIDEDDVMIDVVDGREMMPESILGLYNDTASYHAGGHLDEGYFSDEQTSIKPKAMSTAPLEIFHQLGSIEYLRPGDAQKSNDPEAWLKSNYALLRNVEDGSIYVLWRKIIFREGKHYLAKDIVSAQDYAVFPETEHWHETIIYAKIAKRWDDLAPNLPLQFSYRRHAPSPRGPAEEPRLVIAARANEGGLRRVCGFRRSIPT
ncbi:MAG: hypothetical protein Q9181_005773 [Wetmoreana brouardii]